RQDSTLHATWSRVGCPPEIPVTGERKNIKILGAIELWRTRFDYRQDTVFNATAYLGFLEQLARRYRRQGAILIQDNASYHKDAEVWAWFKSNRHWLEVHQLPPYSPELNPTERLWQHTRKNERPCLLPPALVVKSAAVSENNGAVALAIEIGANAATVFSGER